MIEGKEGLIVAAIVAAILIAAALGWANGSDRGYPDGCTNNSGGLGIIDCD